MPRLPIKDRSRQLYRALLAQRTATIDGDDLRRSAVVFAPHQDDETLGCGGTIIKKRRAGAELSILFLTDGGRSHSHLMPRDELKATRAREAVAASRVLGVDEKDVAFLEFEDTKLDEARDAAVRKIGEILARRQPDQVFVPYSNDAQVDHRATNRIVRSALTTCAKKAVVFEYPVWFWTHWPWANLPIGGRREIVSIVKNSLVSTWRMLRDFRCAVYIGDVLEVKRAALNQYKSQMTRLVPNPRWLTLGDVANGAFLECFFQEYEVFHRHRFSAPR